MSRWKKGTKEFTTKIHYADGSGSSARIPKPILEYLQNPTHLKFKIVENGIILKSTQHFTADGRIK